DLNAAKILKSRANRSALPVEASAIAGLRSGKLKGKLRVPRRRSSESSALEGGVDYGINPSHAGLTVITCGGPAICREIRKRARVGDGPRQSSVPSGSTRTW